MLITDSIWSLQEIIIYDAKREKVHFFPENLNVSLGCPSLQMICYIAGNFEAGNSLNLAVTELVGTVNIRG